MNSNEQKEMTLKEWCDRLPDAHLVNQQRKQIAQTLALLNSMVYGGEQHSDSSIQIVQKAFDNL